MPGRLFLTRPLAEIAAWLDATTGLNDPPRTNIAPGEDIAVVTPKRRLVHMRWGLIPVGRVNARGRPVMETLINARSETLFEKTAYAGMGRALIPCDGWYEWTGARRRKQAWRIARKDGAPLAIAAITDTWTAPGGTTVPQVAAVTCDPNADVRDIHHRMAVFIAPKDAGTWLTGDQTAAARLMRPLPDGTLLPVPCDDPG